MNEPAAIDQEVKPSFGKRLFRYVPLIVWLGVIFYASTSEFSADNTSRFIRPLLRWLLPNWNETELDGLHFLVRKAGHFLEYGVLAFLAARASTTSSRSFIRNRWFELSLLLVVVNSLIDEWHQSFVPSRRGSIYDSLIDMAGGLTALLILKFYYAQSRRDVSR